jgi:hypothetical protein
MTKTAPAPRPPRRLPEASQIAQLLSEVMPDAGPPPAVQAPPPARPAPARAAGSVADFFGRVNWKNDPAFGGAPADAPEPPAAPEPVGGMAVRAFFGQVNWKNERRAPVRTAGDNPYLAPNAQRPKADIERSVEAVLTRFAWD